MTAKRKSVAAVGRAGSSKADLGQKEARLKRSKPSSKRQAMRNLGTWKAAKTPRLLVGRKRKFSLNIRAAT